MYTYLQHFGYQHIHFFGWKNCTIKNINENKKYFLNDFTEEYLKICNLTESELYSNIKVWMSGHTHYLYDFNYRTRFLSNQGNTRSS